MEVVAQLVRKLKDQVPNILRYLDAHLGEHGPWAFDGPSSRGASGVELAFKADKGAGSRTPGVLVHVSVSRGYYGLSDSITMGTIGTGDFLTAASTQVRGTLSDTSELTRFVNDIDFMLGKTVTTIKKGKEAPTVIPTTPLDNPFMGVNWAIASEYFGFEHATFQSDGVITVPQHCTVLIGKRGDDYALLGVQFSEQFEYQNRATGQRTIVEAQFKTAHALVKDMKALPKAIITVASQLTTKSVPKKFRVIDPPATASWKVIKSDNRATLPLKDALAGSGLVDAPQADRKITVECLLEADWVKGVPIHKATLFFNGKPYTLKPETAKALSEDYVYSYAVLKNPGRKVNITRLTGGRMGTSASVVLNHWADEVMANESSAVLLALMQAIESIEGNSKTARAILAHFTPLEAEVFSGRAAIDLVYSFLKERASWRMVGHDNPQPRKPPCSRLP